MSRRFVFDLESDGLLADLTKVHCLVLGDIDTGEIISCADQPGYHPIAYGLEMLSSADLIVGHNSLRFDVPAIKKVYPGWQSTATHRDTLVTAWMLWSDLEDKDEARVEKGEMPRHLRGRYSLEAFGYRLKLHKGDFKGPWDTWTKVMQDYCEQDIRVTLALVAAAAKQIPQTDWWNFGPLTLEHDVATIINRQTAYGFAFDKAAAVKLYGDLVQIRMDTEATIQKAFAPWFRKVEDKVQAADVNRKRPDLGVTVTINRVSKTGKALKPYVGPLIEETYEGSKFTKIERVEFNCNSRHHIADRLIKVWGWKPKEFTQDGSPKIDDEILGRLPYPQAKLLAHYLMIQKRIGMLAEGKGAWIKAEKNGRIHGSVISCGTPTARMTHSGPNIAQVPAGKSPYGMECRSLFVASRGKLLVGCDADALELRDLAGYMAQYDGGAYVLVILEGNKALGTDMHSVNCRALGFDPATHRDMAKTWFYAFIYGAGDVKLGLILGAKGARAAKAIGKKSRDDFLKNLPALGKITKSVKEQSASGYIKGLDGRRLKVRYEHAALNTLLQAAGAIQMKRALVILDVKLQALGLIPGTDYEFVANVHDEWQIEVSEEHVETVKREAEASIAAAGEYYSFGCPLKGNADAGKNWASTH